MKQNKSHIVVGTIKKLVYSRNIPTSVVQKLSTSDGSAASIIPNREPLKSLHQDEKQDNNVYFLGFYSVRPLSKPLNRLTGQWCPEICTIPQHWVIGTGGCNRPYMGAGGPNIG